MSSSIKNITKYFPNLSELQLAQFVKLEELYKTWNAQINVISRKDIDELYIKHVLHSLAIAKVVHFKNGTQILDVGTGGGFPGIPLAILFPKCDFYLVDSIGKKIKVVNEVGQEYKHEFIEQGGEDWDLVESLNINNLWVGTLEDLVKN